MIFSNILVIPLKSLLFRFARFYLETRFDVCSQRLVPQPSNQWYEACGSTLFTHKLG